jgi:ribosomal protein L37E
MKDSCIACGAHRLYLNAEGRCGPCGFANAFRLSEAKLASDASVGSGSRLQPGASDDRPPWRPADLHPGQFDLP